MGSDGSGCLWIGEKVRGVSCNELARWRWDPGLQLNSSHPKNLQKGLGGRAVFPPQKLRSPTRQGVAASPQTGVLAEHSGCLRRGQSRDRCVCVWGGWRPRTTLRKWKHGGRRCSWLARGLCFSRHVRIIHRDERRAATWPLPRALCPGDKQEGTSPLCRPVSTKTPRLIK